MQAKISKRIVDAAEASGGDAF
ncbi:MAG: hypothetical protein RIR33_3539, partial [Pseudomonadota bacterium]